MLGSNVLRLRLLLVYIAVIVLCCKCGIVESAYSSKEKQALTKLRPLVSELLKDDYEKSDEFLIRWLRASQLNVKAANTLLREAKIWRKNNRMDSILKENIINFKRSPYTLDSIDKWGRPVLMLFSSRIDHRKFTVAGKKDNLIRFYDQMLERLEDKLRTAWKERKNITQAVDIIDYSHYNLKQHGCLECFEVYAATMAHYEKYYPSICKAVVFVNLPRIGVPLLEVLRPIMSESTRTALKVFGPDKSDFAPVLLRMIPADQLPRSLGGTKKD